MKNHRYSTAGKIATVIIQQFMAVLLVVFLLLLGSLFSKSMLEFQDIGKGGFLDILHRNLRVPPSRYKILLICVRNLRQTESMTRQKP